MPTRGFARQLTLLLCQVGLGCSVELAATGSVSHVDARDPGLEPEGGVSTVEDLDSSAGGPVGDSGLDGALPVVPPEQVYEDCTLGSARSLASDQSVDRFREPAYFVDGKSLPRGRYRVTYQDGCMKYNLIFLWTVNADPSDGWWLVGESTSDRVALLPGKGGLLPPDAFVDFEACVSANKALPPTEFEFGGGKLGVWLNDAVYADNAAGEGGRNPTWSLTLLQDCPSGFARQAEARR